MSRHHIEKITCPNCKKESDFLLWDSINTSLNPDMKEKVRTGEAFRWNCPFCDAKANIEYATLYHQMEDLVMIYYVPGEGDKTETIELMQGRHKNEDGEYVEMNIKIDEGYMKRVVETKEQFREKLLILDTGLDDRIIELMKAFLTSHLRYKENVEIEKILFDQYENEDDPLGFTIHRMDDTWAYIRFQEDLYEFFKKKFTAVAEYEKDTVVIDSNWAVGILDRLEAQEE